jgi:hypothetical protein
MKMHVGGAPELILDCGRSPDGLNFELDIKSEFPLKTKFREIQRLELVSDKFKVRNS